MTVAELSLKPEGDVVFEFKDSCNCCCWNWKRTKSTTPLYINQRGQVVKFDFQKAANKAASFERSIQNLNRHMEVLAEKHQHEKEEILKRLQDTIEELDATKSKYITRTTLERINDLFSWAF